MSDEWRSDQFGAALSHTRSLAERFQKDLGWEERVAGQTKVDQLADDVRTRFLDGEIALCEHTKAPEPLCMAIAEPTTAYCMTCGPKKVEEIMCDPAREWLCDLCDRPTTIFAEIMLQNGPLLMLGNVCDACTKGDRG